MFTISISSEAAGDLKELRKELSIDANAPVKIDSATIETQQGVAETISILVVAISFASGISSQVIGAWLYDKLLKPKSERPTYHIYLDGKEVKTQEEIVERVDRK